MSDGYIRLRGVSVNNLRHVDLDLPHRQLIVLCGVSGSGKTSLALDTLYAEGQRRYIETFSAYTRQFLEQLDKPNAESIDGIPPAVAVTHKNPTRSNRATVGTVTEVTEYLALLFARLGSVVCYRCGQTVRRQTPQSALENLSALPDGTRIMLGFETAVPQPEAAESEEVQAWVAELIEAGYVRALLEGQVRPLEKGLADCLSAGQTLTVVVDRLTVGKTSTQRLYESLETAIQAGDGRCVALFGAEQSDGNNGDRWNRRVFSTSLRCDSCAIEYPEPQPQLFNFNLPLGACPECEGFGNVQRIDMSRVVPDPKKTLRDGAIAPWNTPAYAHELEELLELAGDYGIPVDVPFSELSELHLQMVDQGVPERNFGGLRGFFRWLERRKYKMHLRVFLSRWRSSFPCQSCHGARMRPEVLAVRVGGKSFAEVLHLTIGEAIKFFADVELSESQQVLGHRLIRDITSRLTYLVEVGVGYLPLDRPLRSLSGGEAQRVALTVTLGSNLVDMLYVLDEPSIGLHPANIQSLAEAVQRLRDRGNTVVVVEHEEEMLRRADQVVEVGPGAGAGGGRIVFQGTPQEMQANKQSNTGGWLAGRRGLGLGSHRRPAERGRLTLHGARGHNLRNLSVEFPLSVLCLVTGVSGAGKSTLVGETLYPSLVRRLRLDNGKSAAIEPLAYDDLLGTGQLDDVVLIDASPIGRSPRSNPVTFVKAFDPIRNLFAELPEAKARGFSASHFSFNVDGGRCEACRGDGYIQVDMQFLADIYMRCSQCGGSRYRRAVREVKYRGRDIAEVLDMTAREAFALFRGHEKVLSRLKCLLDVGLDYLQLGQPATTLSVGEAQRLKLATYVAGRRRGRTLFLLDEPTTGLHPADIVKLLDCFDALLDVGHSLIVVEHNLLMMTAADWLIDLGPGAADAGGTIVAAGTPEEVAACARSETGRFLAGALARGADLDTAALDAGVVDR